MLIDAICIIVMIVAMVVRWRIRKLLLERIDPIARLIEQITGDEIQQRISQPADDQSMSDEIAIDQTEAGRRYNGQHTRINYSRYAGMR